MSDYRDTNHDGKVSLTEKIKDKLHLRRKHKKKKGAHTSDSTGHSGLPVAQPVNHAGLPVAQPVNHAASGSGFASYDLDHDGHVSTNEKILAELSYSSDSGNSSDFNPGHNDSRDLNRDAYVSVDETSAASHDSRDLNRDGHVSMGETFAANSGIESEQTRLRLHEEQLAVSKRAVSAGAVDLHKRVQEEHVERSVPVTHEEVVMERRPYSGDDSSRVPEKDEIARVILYREEVVTKKVTVPVEEVVVRKDLITDQQTVGAVLRSEHVETSQTGTTSASGAFGYVRDVSPGKKFKSDDNHVKAARG